MRQFGKGWTMGFAADETWQLWAGIVAGYVIENRRRNYLAAQLASKRASKRASKPKQVLMDTALGKIMMTPNGLTYTGGRLVGNRQAWDRLTAHRARVQADIATMVADGEQWK